MGILNETQLYNRFVNATAVIVQHIETSEIEPITKKGIITSVLMENAKAIYPGHYEDQMEFVSAVGRKTGC